MSVIIEWRKELKAICEKNGVDLVEVEFNKEIGVLYPYMPMTISTIVDGVPIEYTNYSVEKHFDRFVKPVWEKIKESRNALS